VEALKYLSGADVIDEQFSPYISANDWYMVYNVMTSGRETSAEQAIRCAYISTLKKLGFEGEKGQLREWMTVARDRSAWGRNVEYKLLLPPGSFANLRRH
jgi:hypothetical protein